MSMRSGLVVLANRLPIQRTGCNDASWIPSPGGLVSALTPALGAFEDRTWIGWAGVIDDASEPFDCEGTHLVPLSMSEMDLRDFYAGFCNGCLWPLHHDAIMQPEFHRSWWDAYMRVNSRFAQAAAEAVRPGGTVWINDYHLQLVPGLLRELRPDVRIGFFLHVPFPVPDLFVRLPWHAAIVDGLLGADLVGFQTDASARNFRTVATDVTSARRRGIELEIDDRAVVVDTFPVGVDAERCEQVVADRATDHRVVQLRSKVGAGRRILLGIDRLDYTKGIEQRLRALRELLDAGSIDPASISVVQIAAPSRSSVANYARTRAEVERLVDEINDSYGASDRRLVHLESMYAPFDELVAWYRAADVMVVTPFSDGMNLVAKEFIASRTDERGVLILSEFAGAACELEEALLVNPFDIESVKRSIVTALEMSDEEQSQRMRSMQRAVRSNTATTWAQSFLGALSA